MTGLVVFCKVPDFRGVVNYPQDRRKGYRSLTGLPAIPGSDCDFVEGVIARGWRRRQGGRGRLVVCGAVTLLAKIADRAPG